MSNRVETGHVLAEIEIDRAGYATAHGVGNYEQWPERAKQSLANSIISSIPTAAGRQDYVERVSRAYDSQAHMHGRIGGPQTVSNRSDYEARLEARVAEKDREIARLSSTIGQLNRDSHRDRERTIAWVKTNSTWAIGLKENLPGDALCELGREALLRILGRYGGTVKFTDLDDETKLALRTIIYCAESLREDLKLPKQTNPKQQPPTIAKRAVRKLDLD